MDWELEELCKLLKWTTKCFVYELYEFYMWCTPSAIFLPVIESTEIDGIYKEIHNNNLMEEKKLVVDLVAWL